MGSGFIPGLLVGAVGMWYFSKPTAPQYVQQALPNYGVPTYIPPAQALPLPGTPLMPVQTLPQGYSPPYQFYGLDGQLIN